MLLPLIKSVSLPPLPRWVLMSLIAVLLPSFGWLGNEIVSLRKTVDEQREERQRLFEQRFSDDMREEQVRLKARITWLEKDNTEFRTEMRALGGELRTVSRSLDRMSDQLGRLTERMPRRGSANTGTLHSLPLLSIHPPLSAG